MDKHTEIIFNLFILEYFGYYNIDEQDYKWFTKYNDTFQIEKSCFPENEIACQTLVSGDYEIDFPCNLIHDKPVKVKIRSSKTDKKIINAIKATLNTAKYNKKTRNWEL